MITPKFKGERLKNARLFRGLTLTELAEQAGLSKQALSQYENGTVEPTHPSIASISRALDFPIEYFSAASPYVVKSEAAYFRSLLTTPKKDRVAQSVRLEFIAQIYETLFDYVGFPALHLPQIDFDDFFGDYIDEAEEAAELERAAETTRDFWKLGRDPITDLRYILEENGIVVACAPLNAEKIDAFSQRTLINKGEVFFIVIAQNQTLARARFDMAHELAHILLHPWSEDVEALSKEEFKSRERQANIFAGAFLLPRETFGYDVRHYPTDLEFYRHLKKKWNVSIQAMVYRAHQLEAITISQYQYLMRQMSKNGWRSSAGEPDDQIYKPKSTLLQGAVELLFEKKLLTPASLRAVLRQKGIILNPTDIEEMLSLKEGTLAFQPTPNQKVHQFRLKIPEEVPEEE